MGLHAYATKTCELAHSCHGRFRLIAFVLLCMCNHSVPQPVRLGAADDGSSCLQMLSSQEVTEEADAEKVVHRMPTTAAKRSKAKAQRRQSPDPAAEDAARRSAIACTVCAVGVLLMLQCPCTCALVALQELPTQRTTRYLIHENALS